jgi:hypothetical protein
MNGENPLYEFSQEAVMQDYANSGAFRDARDEGRLHMFFSPYRVPLGLTNKQILICLNMSRLKEQREEAERRLRISRIPEELLYLDEELYKAKLIDAYDLPDRLWRMPKELICSDFMDEERFSRGICLLLASL